MCVRVVMKVSSAIKINFPKYFSEPNPAARLQTSYVRTITVDMALYYVERTRRLKYEQAFHLVLIVDGA